LPSLLEASKNSEELSAKIFELAKSKNIELKDFFKSAYLALINKERGPKLAGFLTALGFEKTQKLFGQL
ncbi:MAG: hypothetical protein Q7R70_01980, partial [Candidatus Diapherotrites archaeon]|nr:hypothetical protein [Candidatus Diapherotrites archaeon]